MYCVLIRPTLKYRFFVGYRHDSDDSNQLERFQRKFLRFALGFLKPLLKTFYAEHDYTPVADQLNLSLLTDCLNNVNLTFINSLLTGMIDSATFLSPINFVVPPHKTRSNIPLYITILCFNQLYAKRTNSLIMSSVNFFRIIMHYTAQRMSHLCRLNSKLCLISMKNPFSYEIISTFAL